MKIGLIAAFSVLLAGAGIAVHPEGLSGHTEADEVAKPIGYSLPETATAADVATVKDCEDCPPLVNIPALPGSKDRLWVMQTELTWAQYVPAMKEAGCRLPVFVRDRETIDDAALDKISDDFPVSGLPVNDIDCYLNWLNQQSGYTYRLPKADEWEHAARAGVQTRYPWGDDIGYNKTAVKKVFDVRDFRQRFQKPFDQRNGVKIFTTVPVAQFEPNNWGLYDVIGNVCEYIEQRPPPPPTRLCLETGKEIACDKIVGRGGSFGDIIWLTSPKRDQPLALKDLDLMEYEFYPSRSAGYICGYRLIREGS